jgi:vacuolar-type H+-ATPase subunit H
MDDNAKKRFNKAREKVKNLYEEIDQEMDKRIKELLEKTYKQFEKTSDAKSEIE